MMENLNLYCSYCICLLGVIMTLVGVLPVLKFNDAKSGLSWINLTKWGKIFVLLGVVTVLLSAAKLFLDKNEKETSAKLGAAALHMQNVFRDSVYLKLNTILQQKGLAINKQNNQITVTNRQTFNQAFNTTSQVVTSPIDTILKPVKQITGDTKTPPIATTSAEVIYPDIDLGAEGKEMTNNTGSYRAYGQCKFINKKNLGITFYYGECISNNIGISKGVYNIAPGRSATSDPLLIGSSTNGGPINPLTSKFEFYFVTNDDTKPKRYGKIAVKITALKESTIQLDDGNLLLTAGGPRNQSYLNYAGIRP